MQDNGPLHSSWGGCLEGCYTSACDDNAVAEACKENSRAACEDADGLTLRVVGILSEIRSTGARHVQITSSEADLMLAFLSAPVLNALGPG